VDFLQIREVALTAIASDDVLSRLLVLKGGNALALVHKIGKRTSLDLDFSMEADFENRQQLEKALTRAVTDRFDAAGYVVFDTSLVFKPQPRSGQVPDWWGGYTFFFKLIPREEYKKFQGSIEDLRRRSTPIDDAQHRKFEIQISRSEYCRGSEKRQVGDYELLVYTPGMIACEKLRAICQQMPEYEMAGDSARAPRARDFYDIHVLVQDAGVDFGSPDMAALVKAMFQVKHVPVGLLRNIGRDASFHELDWPKVKDAVHGPVKEFAFYVQSVLAVVSKLEAGGVMDAP
jgi:hypothetical protein